MVAPAGTGMDQDALSGCGEKPPLIPVELDANNPVSPKRILSAESERTAGARGAGRRERNRVGLTADRHARQKTMGG